MNEPEPVESPAESIDRDRVSDRERRSDWERVAERERVSDRLHIPDRQRMSDGEPFSPRSTASPSQPPESLVRLCQWVPAGFPPVVPVQAAAFKPTLPAARFQHQRVHQSPAQQVLKSLPACSAP